MKRFLPLLLLVLLVAAPLPAALTVVYCDFDLATGLNDGTSEANAYQTWDDCFGSMAAGQCINVQRTSARHNLGASKTWTASGSNTQPIFVIGYNTTPGNCSTTWGDGDTSGIDNFFQSGAGNYTLTISADNIRAAFFDWAINASFTTAVTISTGANQVVLYKFYTENSNTGGNSKTISNSGTGSAVMHSYMKCSPAGNNDCSVFGAASGVALANRYDLTGSTSTGTPQALELVGSSSSQQTVAMSLFRGPSALTGTTEGIRSSWSSGSDDRTLLLHNSFRDFDSGIRITSINGTTLGQFTIAGNVMYNVDTGLVVDSGTANLGLHIHDNAIEANVARWDSSISPKPLVVLWSGHDVTLTADPFTDTAWDMSLNATAGGGALCRDVSQPVDIARDNTDLDATDIGAVQGDY